MSYYKEKQRATREADHLINEVLYIRGDAIDLIELEKVQAPRFMCNFMKIFEQRLELYMKSDTTIKRIENVIMVEK